MRLRVISLLLIAWIPTANATSILEEVVVTAARSEQPVSEAVTNISIVSGQDLSLIGHTHINETLSRVSGAWISRGNGQEHLTALRSPVFTGAGACGSFLLMEDGIPLRASGFCNANELFDSNAEQAGSLEVIKGPASSVYGSNAMHGLINVITPSIAVVRNLTLEAGPHDYRRAKVSLGNDAWRLDANGATDGGYKDDSGFGQQKITVKHQRDIGDWSVKGAIAASNLNQETAGYLVGALAYKDDALRKTNPNPEAYRDTRAIRAYARFERDIASGRIVVTPYFRDTDMDFIQHFLPGQAIEQNGHTSFGVQSAWYLDQWTAGVDVELTRGFLKETQPNPTVGSPFLVATIPQGDHYNYDVDARTLALFGERRFTLGDQTELSLGLRAETVTYDYDNKMPDGRTKADGTPCGFGGCRFNRPADRTDTFSNVSPKIGLSHFVGDQAQLYAFLSRGYRAPHVTELYRLQDGQDITTIDSEQLDSFEIGVRGGDNAFSYEVSTYVMRKDNYIFRDTNRANVDNGETSHRGLEVSIAGALTESLRAAFNWSYAIHRYENNPALVATNIEGNDIDTAPRHLGSANLQWRPRDGVSTELEWVHIGRYFEDDENLNPYEGHDLINLRAEAKLAEHVAGFIRITNLADTDYAERADFAFGVDRYFVGEPRSFYVGITASF